jgi:hypothetical protein
MLQGVPYYSDFNFKTRGNLSREAFAVPYFRISSRPLPSFRAKRRRHDRASRQHTVSLVLFVAKIEPFRLLNFSMPLKVRILNITN